MTFGFTLPQISILEHILFQICRQCTITSQYINITLWNNAPACWILQSLSSKLLREAGNSLDNQTVIDDTALTVFSILSSFLTLLSNVELYYFDF